MPEKDKLSLFDTKISKKPSLFDVTFSFVFKLEIVMPSKSLVSDKIFPLILIEVCENRKLFDRSKKIKPLKKKKNLFFI